MTLLLFMWLLEYRQAPRRSPCLGGQRHKPDRQFLAGLGASWTFFDIIVVKLTGAT